jgi:hypothetical protein
MDRKTQLARLLPGDMFHGSCSNDASLICLIEEVGEDRIVARRITTQERLFFDLKTGREIGDKAACTIDSIAPLPVPVHNTLLDDATPPNPNPHHRTKAQGVAEMAASAGTTELFRFANASGAGSDATASPRP